MIANFVNNMKFINGSSITITTSGKNALISDTGANTKPYMATTSGINITSGAAVTSGFANIVDNEQLNLFPNPSTVDRISLKANDEISKIAIYSMTGQKVIETVGNRSNELTVNTSGITTGCYLVNVLFQKGTSGTLKFIRK